MAHALCILILLARISDLVSTRLATPTLTLEANPVMRRLGWRFGLASLVLCLVPYYNTALGFFLLVASLTAGLWNFRGLWLPRAMGEAEYEALLLAAARRSRLRSALWPLYASAMHLGLLGLLFVFVGGGTGTWSFWGGLGLLCGGVSIALHGTLFQTRLYRRARLAGDAPPPGEGRGMPG